MTTEPAFVASVREALTPPAKGSDMRGLTDMFDAYVECALWSSTDEDGDPLDEMGYELSSETESAMRAECAAFLQDEYTREVAALWSLEQFGHDFWLTRNRHGAGFWDRGHGKIGDRLSDAAHVYGSYDLFLGDDGMVYGS